MSMERPQRENPMTEPARNAVLKASVQALEPAAMMVVRALENTATFMPIRPETMDVTPPATKAMAVSPPSSMWNSPPVYETRNRTTRPKARRKYAQIVYSARRNESAPSRIAS